MSQRQKRNANHYPTPEEFPDFIAYCTRCGTNTMSAVQFRKNDALGNACAVCGTLRKGLPFISNEKYKSLKAQKAKGGQNEASIS